ncbi:MAG: HD domain-containing protein, partial [Actinobacteria bacterium]|nr:HD domain-containing protein [Actinomycetota bacterium]
MTSAASPVSAERLSDDALLAFIRDEESRPLVRVGRTGVLTTAFFVVAVGAPFLPAHRPFSALALCVAVVVYAIASRVQFEYAQFFAVPTQAVFVPMWFILPARMLPLTVCCALLLGALPDVVRGRTSPDRLALKAVSSWHAVGPALVLYLAHTRAPEWRDAPIYVAAIAAQFVFDWATVVAWSLVRMPALQYIREAAPSFAVDTMLGSLGLLVAFPAYERPWSLLLLLPVLLLFSRFAGERQKHIDKALELSSAYRGTALLLGDVIEADDAYTGSHSRDVVSLVLAVADRIGLDPEERRQAEFAALLHDVGKVKIPPEIINKPGPLDDDERALMNTHTILGEEMLHTIGGLLGEVGSVVRSCHERWDGGGYPDGLAGEQIPLGARIIAVCDAFDAMATTRSYREAVGQDEALAELRRCAGGQFDPRVVEAFER